VPSELTPTETRPYFNADLCVDGVMVEPSADYSVRFVEGQDVEGGVRAVLYHKGKRVTRAWGLTLVVGEPPDPNGGNANTE
jgi:hypothetical protein